MKIRTHSPRGKLATNRARGAKAKHRPPVSRVDPSRTGTLRRAFTAELHRRFARLRGAIVRLVVGDDALGLVATPTPRLPSIIGNANLPPDNTNLAHNNANSLTLNNRWRHLPNSEKLRAFTSWLRTTLATGGERGRARLTDAELWRRYVEDGFRKGAGRAFDDVRPAAGASVGGDAQVAPAGAGATIDPASRRFGAREEFLRRAFGQPESVEKVKLLVARAADDFEAMEADLASRVTRALADGLVQGKNPGAIARDITAATEMSEKRANVIARTSIIAAHAEGQLTALEDMGVEEVGVMVEWQTTADERLCPRCAAMQGVVLKIEEARGLIPAHPNCRCAFLPSNVSEDRTGQVRGKRGIERAMRRADIEPTTPIASKRPRSILNSASPSPHITPELVAFSRAMRGLDVASVTNVFCPTGEGGGVDPTCPVGGKGATAPAPAADVGKLEAKVKAAEKKLKDAKASAERFKTSVFTQALARAEKGLAKAKAELAEAKGGTKVGPAKSPTPTEPKPPTEPKAARAPRLTTPDAVTEHFEAAYNTNIKRGNLSDDEFVNRAKVVAKDYTHMTSEFSAVRERIASRRSSETLEVGRDFATDPGEYRGDRHTVRGYYQARPDGGRMVLSDKLEVDDREIPSVGGFHVGRDFGSTFRHEFGHEVYDGGNFASRQRNWNREMAKHVGTSSVSQYGGTNAAELFAESFSAYTSRRYRRGTLPADIESWMDKNVKGS